MFCLNFKKKRHKVLIRAITNYGIDIKFFNYPLGRNMNNQRLKLKKN